MNKYDIKTANGKAWAGYADNIAEAIAKACQALYCPPAMVAVATLTRKPN